MSISATISTTVTGVGNSATDTKTVTGNKSITISEVAAANVINDIFTGDIAQADLKMIYLSTDQTIKFSGYGAAMTVPLKV